MNRAKDDSERISDVEIGLMLMGKDFHTLSETVQSVDRSLNKLIEIQQDSRVERERSEARHEQNRKDKERLHKRITELEEKVDRGFKDMEVVRFFSKYYKLTIPILIGIGVLLVKEVRDYLGLSIGG